MDARPVENRNGVRYWLDTGTPVTGKITQLNGEDRWYKNGRLGNGVYDGKLTNRVGLLFLRDGSIDRTVDDLLCKIDGKWHKFVQGKSSGPFSGWYDGARYVDGYEVQVVNVVPEHQSRYGGRVGRYPNQGYPSRRGQYRYANGVPY